MHIITTPGFAEQTITKSRFIAFATYTADERAVGAAFRAFAAQHASANHLAYGFRVKTVDGIVQRFSDAGEPSGTAGVPLLKLIESRELINIGLAVIRYYGGVNLGTGGLARAYGGTGKIALDAAGFATYVEMTELKLIVEYSQFDELARHLSKINGEVVDKTFANQVTVLARLPKENAADLMLKYPSLY
ncbi:MAG: YigZ family protein [Methylophilaceae bacterium]|nr:YigZ family protein [Methylophilaceae bacterium]